MRAPQSLDGSKRERDDLRATQRTALTQELHLHLVAELVSSRRFGARVTGGVAP